MSVGLFEILSYDLLYRMSDIVVPFILISVRKSCRIDQSRRMRWAGHVARTGERRGVYRVLTGEPEGKRPLGRPRRRWEDNIMDESS